MFLNKNATVKNGTIKKHISFLVALVIMLCSCILVTPDSIVNAEEYAVDYLGASISFEAPRNLRFKFEIANSELENVKEYGALISTAYEIGNKVLSMDSDINYTKAVAFDSEKGVDAVFSRNNGAVQYAVSLNGIEDNDYDKLFTVRPYVVYNDGTIGYGEEITQSVYGVAVKAANDTEVEYTTTERGGFFKIAEDHAVDSENRPVNIASGNNKAVEIQRETNARVEAIRNAASDYTASGKVYYVSASGSDSNNGTSENTPWKSLSKVSSVSLSSGDVVLFKRGDVFRGQLSMKDGVTYSAYGQGSKPCIYGSPENAADASSWSLLEGFDNIWVYKNEIPDVGLVVLNDGENLGLKVNTYFSGNRFVDADGNDFDIVATLDKNYEFFSECDSVIGSNGYPVLSKSTGKLYFYCDKGNPAEVFESIELCCYGNILNGSNTKNVIVDNLCVKYGGSHGIGTSNATNFTVRNCEIAWIGGSIQSYNATTGKAIRYGNGVQVHSACNGYYVHDNYIYQVFDAGITHQQGDLLGTNCLFTNISYKNNVIEKCAWSVEYYMNTPGAGFEHKMSNIDISGNIMRLSGSGFGQYRDDEWHYPCHIMSWWNESSNSNKADGDTVTITDNIFDRCEKSLVEIHAAEETSLPIVSGNTYIQYVDGVLGRYTLSELNSTDNQNYYNNMTYNTIRVIDDNADIYFTDYRDIINSDVLEQQSYLDENPVSETYGFKVNLANKDTTRYFKVLENGIRLTETKIDSLKNNSVGEPVKIAFFSDTHFVGTLTEEDKTKQHLVDLYELRKNTFRNTVKSTPVSLAFGDLFDRTVIGGDLFDFYSEGNINLFKSTVTYNYPDALTLLGNHESSEGFSGITPESPMSQADIYADLNDRIFGYSAIKTEGTIETLEQAEEYNDIYLAHNLVKDSLGNEKALLLLMDNQNYTYQFSNFHYNRLKFYIDYAHEHKLPVLIFQHTPLCTGRTTEIVSPYDIIENGNGKGENWGTGASTALAGAPYHDTRNPMTTKVYDLIVNNADVVKGVFCGHVHNNIYTEIVAKTSNGVDTVIPQYTIAGNYFYSNINLITVE